jgi:hypothetical protein
MVIIKVPERENFILKKIGCDSAEIPRVVCGRCFSPSKKVSTALRCNRSLEKILDKTCPPMNVDQAPSDPANYVG